MSAVPPSATRPARSRRVAALGAALALAALLGGLGGGLVRLGTLPALAAGPTGPQAVGQHGALMMAGFFGAVIALERAVALQRGGWVPALAGAGALIGWVHGWWAVSAGLWLASSLGLLHLYAWAARHRAASLPLAVEASGAAALTLGTLAWWLGPPEAARLGWSAFLLLTIAGERRELMRLVPLPAWAARAFLLGWAALGLAPLLAWWAPAAAAALWWTACAALAAWLLAFDIARRLRHAAGWAGHTARCLLAGYAWLAVAAVLGLAGRPEAWHALWLGFVMAMVFGHAPIMLPALAGWRPVFTRWALAPLGLLGASLALRLGTTLVEAPPSWLAVAGAGHVLALLGFGAVMAAAVRRGAQRPSA